MTPAQHASLVATGAPRPAQVRRLTWLLFFGQSLGSAGFIAGATVGVIVGAKLSGQPALAGVPGALYLVGNALAAYPAARFMERVGRRPGLTLGFAVGVAGALIAGAAVLAGSFPAFLLGFALMGGGRGVTDLGRYAAAETHPPAERARAISLVVLGGTVGALGGPALVKPVGEIAAALQRDPLSGPWFASAVLFALGALLMALFLRPDPRDLARRLDAHAPEKAPAGEAVRELGAILRQPGTQVAIAAMVLGQLIMIMLMAISSLHVYGLHTGAHDHGLGDVSIVITAHALGMYGLSVVAGRLADRFGRAATIAAGAALLVAACLLAPLSQGTPVIALALFLLGLGWNFCYVAGGALLTDTLTLAERGRMQGSVDLLVALTSAVGNLASGAVYAAVGYAWMSWLALIVTLVPLALAVNSMRQSRGLAVADTI